MLIYCNDVYFIGPKMDQNQYEIAENFVNCYWFVGEHHICTNSTVVVQVHKSWNLFGKMIQLMACMKFCFNLL